MSDQIDRAVEAASRAIHEHDANASMSGVQWPEWGDLNAEGQFAYASVATDVLEALDDAGLLATPEHDAAVAAKALRDAAPRFRHDRPSTSVWAEMLDLADQIEAGD